VKNVEKGLYVEKCSREARERKSTQKRTEKKVKPARQKKRIERKT